MKHLSAESLAAIAEGQTVAAAQRAHLAVCPACRAEVAELSALMADLAETPAPPVGLHAATLRRIGLKPTRALGRPLRWAWLGGAVAAGLALLLLPPSQVPRCLVHGPSANLAPGSRPAAPARHAAAPVASPPAGAIAPASAAAPIKSQAAEEVQASAPQAPATAPALGQAPAPQLQDQTQAQQGTPDFKATPTPALDALHITAVRGNLLRSAQGERFQADLSLDRTELLVAQVLDSRGRLVAELMHAQAGPGPVQLSWDGHDTPSGAYTLKLAFAGQHKTLNILLVR